MTAQSTVSLDIVMEQPRVNAVLQYVDPVPRAAVQLAALSVSYRQLARGEDVDLNRSESTTLVGRYHELAASALGQHNYRLVVGRGGAGYALPAGGGPANRDVVRKALAPVDECLCSWLARLASFYASAAQRRHQWAEAGGPATENPSAPSRANAAGAGTVTLVSIRDELGFAHHPGATP